MGATPKSSYYAMIFNISHEFVVKQRSIIASSNAAHKVEILFRIDGDEYELTFDELFSAIKSVAKPAQAAD